MTLERIIHNVQILDVVRQRLFHGWVGIRAGKFVYVEPGERPTDLAALEVKDGSGALMCPGLIDAHMHIESSLTTPRRFAEGALRHGTTCVLTDPHELANVLGPSGVWYTLEASQNLALRVYVAVPSCVPATSSELETALGRITAADVRALAQHERVIALGEVMDYQGLARGVTDLPALIEAAQHSGLLIEGHTPTLGGRVLSEYTAYGILSDHTLSTPNKLLEQLSKGYTVMLQEKSLSVEVVETVLSLPDRSRVLLVTDDVMPNRLVSGHLSRLIDRAVALGWPWEDAVAAASLRPAMYLGLHHLGLLAPGRAADFSLLETATPYRPSAVFIAGREVVARARPPLELPETPAPPGGEFTRRLPLEGDFGLALADGVHKLAVLGCNAVNTLTTLERSDVALVRGFPQDLELCFVSVFTRQGNSAPGQALLRGFGLRSGAFASSLAHDSHNLLVVGRSPQDMAQAASRVLKEGGGMAFCDGAEQLFLPLEVAGVTSDRPLEHTAADFEALEQALRARGVAHLNPILFLTILTLTVSPLFKVSDRGLVDVEARKRISLFDSFEVPS